MTRIEMRCVLCVLILISGVSFGQDKQTGETSKPPAVQTEPGDGRHYQAVFVAREVEGGKVINSRKYETDMALQGSMSGSGSIRTGARVPTVAGAQYTYSDVNINLDFNHARLEGDRVFLSITAEVSSIDTAAPGSALQAPTIRQNKWNGGVTVPLGKPTVIFSSDDVTSKRTMQIELTVTQVR